jgi:hypothetical protein
MPILNTLIYPVGQSGIAPTVVLIQTNDTVATVTQAGYLDGLVKEGFVLSQAMMALVVTTPTPSSTNYQPGFYTVSITGNKIYSLVPYPVPIPPVNAWLLTGNEPTGDQFLGTLGLQTLFLQTNSIVVASFDPAQNISFFPNNFTISAAGIITITSPANIFLGTTGLAAVTIGTALNTLNLSSGIINLPNIASGTASSVLYYGVGGTLTYGALPSIFLWSVIAGSSQTIVPNMGYVAENAGLTTFTLPSVCPAGAVIGVVAGTAAGWTLTQNAGQNVQVGELSSTVGVGGSVSSTQIGDALQLVCSVANTTFIAISVIGTLTIV